MAIKHCCPTCCWTWNEKGTLPATIGDQVSEPVMEECRRCMWMGNQTQASIRETRRAIGLLFPRHGFGFGETGSLKLYVEGEEEPIEVQQAETFILSIKSPVFKTMMESLKGDQKLILKNTSVHLLEAVISFLYTGRISYSENVTHERILKFAQDYRMGELKGACLADLSRSASEETICVMLRLSKRCNLTILQDWAMEFLQENIKEVSFATIEEMFKLAIVYGLWGLKKACEIEFTARIRADALDSATLSTLKFASDYRIESLKRACEIKMSKTVTAENLKDILELSDPCQLTILLTAAYDFYLLHSNELSENVRDEIEGLLGDADGGQLKDVLDYCTLEAQKNTSDLMQLKCACENLISRRFTLSR